jgi:hypothetical protein
VDPAGGFNGKWTFAKAARMYYCEMEGEKIKMLGRVKKFTTLDKART